MYSHVKPFFTTDLYRSLVDLCVLNDSGYFFRIVAFRLQGSLDPEPQGQNFSPLIFHHHSGQLSKQHRQIHSIKLSDTCKLGNKSVKFNLNERIDLRAIFTWF